LFKILHGINWLFGPIGIKLFEWIKELVMNVQFHSQVYKLNLINNNLFKQFDDAFDWSIGHCRYYNMLPKSMEFISKFRDCQKIVSEKEIMLFVRDISIVFLLKKSKLISNHSVLSKYQIKLKTQHNNEINKHLHIDFSTEIVINHLLHLKVVSFQIDPSL
jgi:hypothetical protein